MLEVICRPTESSRLGAGSRLDEHGTVAVED